jgi:nucleoporin SEH1
MTSMDVDNEMMMSAGSPSQAIQSMHLDYIHKVSFDVYGRRIATCSGDRFVRVWELQDSGEWALTSQWQAHKSAVTCLDWAHPEFGSILATCGSDHHAKIWEEQNPSSAAGGLGSVPSGGASASSRWVARASLTEARRGVTCVEFAPRYWGLKLAVGSADGCVRIYEAIDIMNLTQWPLAATLQSFQEGNNKGCTCLSWSTGRFEAPTLVAGGSHLVLYRYAKSPGGTQAWHPILKLPSPENGDVLSVAWAPNVGRRFHYIASAEDSQLRIYKLSRELVPPTKEGASGDGGPVPTILSTQTLATHVWRVQWNVTGTVLASSGDGGRVQLWKADADENFQLVSEVHGDADGMAGGPPPAMDTA